MYRTAAQIERDYHRTIDQHRREQRQRRAAYAASLTAEPHIPGLRPHVLFVWRRDRWCLLAFVRHRPSPARWRYWRRRYRVQEQEVVRALSLFHCQRNGPPVDAPAKLHVKRGVGGRQSIEATVTPILRSRAKAGAPQCWHAKRRPACKRKATWLVGFRHSSTGQQRVLNGCTAHAWDDAALPKHATQVLRVTRSILASSTLS